MERVETAPEGSEDTGKPAKKKLPPEVEAREARPPRVDEHPTPPYEDIYLIERQAIEVRRVRAVEAENKRQWEARKREGRDFNLETNVQPEPSREETLRRLGLEGEPSPKEETDRYQRPSADAAQSLTGSLARITAWLRRAVRSD